MAPYVLRRLALLVPIWLLISFFAFLLGSLAPGDPALAVLRRQSDNPPTAAEIATERHRLHLDQPFLVRYARWAGSAAHGDLGRSFNGEPVRATLANRFVVTLELAVPALLLSLLIAIPVGLLSATFRGSVIDHGVRVVSLVGASIPSFWLGYIFIIVISVHLRLLPVAGQGGLRHLVLPACTLALGAGASLGRLLRSSLLEALGEDHVRTARAKGVGDRAVIIGHALPNALLPVVTVAGLRFGQLLAGAAIVETVFSWPGVGTYVINAINSHDYPVIQGFVVFTGTVFVLVNLGLDLLYASLDPRVQLTGEVR